MVYIFNKDLVVQKVERSLLVFDSEKSILHTLNESAGFIFTCLKKGWDEEKILTEFEKKFQITKKDALEDVTVCIKDLLKKDIINKKH